MIKRQQKGVANILIILTIVSVLIVGASLYFVFRKPDRNDASISSETILTANETEPNGTVDNAVNAAENQLGAELISENSALNDEDASTQIDSSLISELEAMANEENL